jgi:DNA-binding NtrC family response regulator
MLTPVPIDSQEILHVGSRELIIELREQILKHQGYLVDSTLSLSQALSMVHQRAYSLVLIDVEGEGRVPSAEKLCEDIREIRPNQKVGFLCNYRVDILSDCPDEIIRAEFNPQAMVDGVRKMLEATN